MSDRPLQRASLADVLADGPLVYCASVPALEAAAEAYPGNEARGLIDALIAVHHGRLGMDRSVCLRDVVDFLRGIPVSGQKGYDLRRAADVLEREFGSGSTPIEVPRVG